MLYLFGSTARGDYDSKSDRDILVVVKDSFDRDEVLSQFQNEGANVSVYSIARLRSMYEMGHLFSWHLFKEAKFIGSPGTEDIVAKLGVPNPYRNARKDILVLCDLFESCLINIGRLNPIYEKGLAYVALRNASMSSSWYSPSGLNFTRYSPYKNSISSQYFDIDIQLYEHLIDCRLATTRGIEPKSRDISLSRTDIKVIRNWFQKNLTIVGELANVKQVHS